MKVTSFLSNKEELLKQAFKIREKVFVEEQQVVRDEEFDEFDQSCIHYLSYENDQAVATSRWRITEKGVKLERFAVLSEARRKGHASRLMEKMLLDVPLHLRLYMHAQTDVIPFYKLYGFTQIGNEFMECDIPHYIMEKTYESFEHKMSLQRSINHVKDFHKAFSLHVGEEPSVEVDRKLIDLRYNLMKEENEEYYEAAKNGDLVEIADAMGDMLYILNGTILTHGMQGKIEEVYEEIQRSNMSKLDKDGNPIYREDGKVMKSDLYFKPNIREILDKD